VPGETARPGDAQVVARRLGRRPAGGFEVVVRDALGDPAVIANQPLLADGTPMPTRYWLIEPGLRSAVSRLESQGGVAAAGRAVDPDALAAAHAEYARQRDALLDPAYRGPRPAGGVGGTRRGVKCLHAHLAFWLAGGEDPVGDWVAERLGLTRDPR
jgi:hypothetical protein